MRKLFNKTASDGNIKAESRQENAKNLMTKDTTAASFVGFSRRNSPYKDGTSLSDNISPLTDTER